MHVGPTEPVADLFRAFVAERNGTTWSEAQQSAPVDSSVVDLHSFRGRAGLMIIHDQATRTVRSQ